MPKIIEGAREKIIQVARQRLFKNGYLHMSLREVAKESGIATGTIYNYFPSKEALVACLMMEDWDKAKEEIYGDIYAAEDVAEGMMDICDRIEQFREMYAPVFEEPTTTGASSYQMRHYHTRLCERLAEAIDELLAAKGFETPGKFSLLFAKNVLAATGNVQLKEQLRELLTQIYPKK